MDRNGLQAQLESGLVAGAADDNDALLVHDEGLPEAEGSDRGGHGIHGLVVVARVVHIGFDGCDVAQSNVHKYLPFRKDKDETPWGPVTSCGPVKLFLAHVQSPRAPCRGPSGAISGRSADARFPGPLAASP